MSECSLHCLGNYLEGIELVDLAHIEVFSFEIELVGNVRCQEVELGEIAGHFYKNIYYLLYRI